jgi:hypothetical protein
MQPLLLCSTLSFVCICLLPTHYGVIATKQHPLWLHVACRTNSTGVDIIGGDSSGLAGSAVISADTEVRLKAQGL